MTTLSNQEEHADSSVKKKPSLIINALSNWATLGINMVVGFILVPFVIRSLGKNGYGIWALVGSVVGYYGLLRLGVGSGIMRYVPYHLAREEDRAASEIVSTALAIFVVVGLVIAAISFVAAEVITNFFSADVEFTALLRIIGIAAAIECPTRIFDACVRAHEKYVYANCVEISATLLRAAGIIASLLLGFGLKGMGFAVLVSTIFSSVLAFGLFVKFCPMIYIRRAFVKLFQVRILLSFGATSTIISLVYSMSNHAHKMIVGKMMSLEAVGIYAVAVTLIMPVVKACRTPARVLWPRFAYLDGRGKREEMVRLFLRTTKYFAMLSSGLMLIMFVGGPAIIRVWVGSGFEDAYLPLIVLAAAYLFETSQATVAPYLGASGHQTQRAVLATIEGIIGFGLSILCTWKMGIVGAPAGFMISSVLIRGLACPLYVCYLLKIKFVRYYRDSLVRPWVIMLLLVVASYSINIMDFVDDWPSAFLLAGMLESAYAGCVFFIVLNNRERAEAVSFVSRGVRRLLARSRAPH